MINIPYVKQENREELDEIVELMGALMNIDGDLNYVLFKFCKTKLVPTYRVYKSFIGELNECVAEIRRRLLAPYEDEKIRINGDIE